MSSLLGIDISKFSQYWPYTKEQWGKISQLWDIYREAVGLEGELYLQLKGKGKNENEISEAINKHNKDVAGNREAWHQLRGEILR